MSSRISTLIRRRMIPSCNSSGTILAIRFPLPVREVIRISTARPYTHNGLPYTEEAGLKGPFMDNGVNLMAALFEQD